MANNAPLPPWPDCSCCKHERELRQQWQETHLLAHKAEEIARTLASTNIDRRLEGMNELRAQITSERGNYVTRDSFDRDHTALREAVDVRLRAVELSEREMQGRVWTAGAAVGVILVIVEILLRVLVK